MNRIFEIIVETSWCHPEFVGTRFEQKRFRMEFGAAAELYYINQLKDCQASGGLAHCSIKIVEVC